jgi:hypothetical protein
VRVRHWLWIAAGLACWAAVVVLWTTGPYDCHAPDETGKVVCKRL